MIYLATCGNIHYLYDITEKKYIRLTDIKLEKYSYHKFVYIIEGWLYEGRISNIKLIPKKLSYINEKIKDISDLETLLLSKILDNL